MTTYRELTTVYAVRSEFSSIVGASDDALMLDIVRGVSNLIRSSGKQEFVPVIETHYFDTPQQGRDLLLDAPLLSVTTLTNGNGTAFTSDQYALYPSNITPKYKVKVLASSSMQWQTTNSGNVEQAISLAGIWGYHEEYANAWAAIDTLAANVTTTSATSITTTGSGLLLPGMLLKIGTEFLYCSVDATTTGTVVRGVNGSTAATHTSGDTIYYWKPDAELTYLAMEASAARYRLRNNPLAETFVAGDGTQLLRPRDVDRYIDQRIKTLGLRYEVFA